MSDDFELGGEDEMSLRQAWPFQRNYILREVWDAYRRTGEHLCL